MAQDKDKDNPRKNADELVDWFTVSYRSIYIAAFVVLALAAAAGYWYFRPAQPGPVAGPEPATAPAATTAAFVFIEGSVQVKKAGQLQWLAATKDMTLHEGDLVRTGGGAGAEIRFTSGTTFHMRADVLITIEKAGEDPESKRQSVTAALQSGEVNFRAGAATTTIQTPVSTTQVGRNAEGGVAVTPSGESFTRIYRVGDEGASVETKDGKTVALGANQALKVDAAGKPGETLSLPAVPVLMAPPHETEISYANPAVATTLLAWKPAADAITYHVLVDFTTNFTRPLVDQKGWKPTSMELRGFDVGRYYWKVAAVDSAGNEGSFSDVSRFAVTRPAPGQQGDAAPPPLSIDAIEPNRNVIHVKGRTEPGASLTVNGQRVDVQTDGTFNEFITLEKPGRQTVVFRAVSVGRRVNEQKRPVVVNY